MIISLPCSNDEFSILWQALNEGLNGFGIEAFEEKTGELLEDAREKYFDILKNQKGSEKVNFTRSEIKMFLLVLDECDQYFEDWEFSTRMNCTREELRTLMGKIKLMLK